MAENLTNRYVTVPIAGHLTFTLTSEHPPEVSGSWSDETTGFEGDALDAASKLLESLMSGGAAPEGLEEWDLLPITRITSGNVLWVEYNEITVHDE